MRWRVRLYFHSTRFRWPLRMRNCTALSREHKCISQRSERIYQGRSLVVSGNLPWPEKEGVVRRLCARTKVARCVCVCDSFLLGLCCESALLPTRGRICARLADYVCAKPHPLLVLRALCGCSSADCALCGAACACVAQPVPSSAMYQCSSHLLTLTHEIQCCTYRERATKHAHMQSALRYALGVVLVMRMRTCKAR